MVKKSLLILFLGTVAVPVAPAGDLFLGLLATSENIDTAMARDKVAAFVNKLEAKGGQPEIAFLRKLFRKTHQQFLRHYVPHADFGSLFTSGSYDCLTATSLFATLLDRFGYRYAIYETTHHIFLIADTDEGQVLMESTDPIYGFESDPQQIEERIHSYLQNDQEERENTYTFRNTVFREVDGSQLAGLLLFNQAVNAFNARRFEVASKKLADANRIYRNLRNAELAALILQMAASLEEEARREIQATLIPVLAERSVATR